MLGLGNPRRRGGDLGLLLLFLEVARVGVEHIPQVTLATLAINVAIHIFSPFNWELERVCVSGAFVLFEKEFARMILSPIYHFNDFHLYYNMTSLIWKGRRLERLVGSWTFGCMLVVFALGTNILLMITSFILMETFELPDSFYTCTVGFSGVLFALKVVVNDLDPHAHGYVFGIPVQMRYLAWAELGLVYVFVPNSSFLGHLCGIAMGYAYKSGILRFVFKALDAAKESYNNYDGTRTFRTHNEGTFSSAGATTGYRPTPAPTPIPTRTAAPSYTTTNRVTTNPSTFSSNNVNNNNNMNNNNTTNTKISNTNNNNETNFDNTPIDYNSTNNTNNSDNTNNNNNNNNFDANIDNTEEIREQAQNDEGFRNRYANYNYQKGAPKKKPAAQSSYGPIKQQAVVGGWCEK